MTVLLTQVDTGDTDVFVTPLDPLGTANDISTLFKSMGVGGRTHSSSLVTRVNPVSATGTYTLSGGSGTETATINGVAIAITWATSDLNSAALLAAAINASTNALVQYLVTATSAAGTGTDGVVTVTATPGTGGNQVTTAASGTGNTAGQTRLTGGTNGTRTVFAY